MVVLVTTSIIKCSRTGTINNIEQPQDAEQMQDVPMRKKSHSSKAVKMLLVTTMMGFMGMMMMLLKRTLVVMTIMMIDLCLYTLFCIIYLFFWVY